MGICRGNNLPCSSPVGEELIVSVEAGCVKHARPGEHGGRGPRREIQRHLRRMRCLDGKNLVTPPTPPTNLHEYQTKGLTKVAFRNLFILKEAILVVLALKKPVWLPL